MTRLFDGTKTAEITMRSWNSNTNSYTPDWSNDFFEIGGLEYDDEHEAYKVDDVEYCVEQAQDWEDMEGDFAADEEPDHIKRQVIAQIVRPVINLVHFTAETGLIKAGAKKPEDLYDFAAMNDGAPEYDTMDDTPENREKARKWLAGKRNSCRRVSGFVGSFYAVEAFAIGYCTVDEDGDYISGGDFDPAEDEVTEDE